MISSAYNLAMEQRLITKINAGLRLAKKVEHRR